LAELGTIRDEELDPEKRLPLIADGKKSEGRRRGLPPPDVTEGVEVTLVGAIV